MKKMKKKKKFCKKKAEQKKNSFVKGWIWMILKYKLWQEKIKTGDFFFFKQNITK